MTPTDADLNITADYFCNADFLCFFEPVEQIDLPYFVKVSCDSVLARDTNRFELVRDLLFFVISVFLIPDIQVTSYISSESLRNQSDDE